MSTAERLRDAWRPEPAVVLAAGALVLAEALLAAWYVLLTRPVLARPLFVVLVPFVWLNLALWVFLRVRPATGDARRLPALLVAAGYFCLLAVLGGLVFSSGPGAAGLRVQLQGFPGWVPLVVFDGAILDVVVVPFKVVGYLALAYLVYVTAVDAAGAIVGGAVGLLSCVSCTFPLIAGVVTSLTGGGAAAAAVYSNSYLLSTAVFAATVGLLAWRPSVASIARLRAALTR